jgi:hypothetical protein
MSLTHIPRHIVVNELASVTFHQGHTGPQSGHWPGQCGNVGIFPKQQAHMRTSHDGLPFQHQVFQLRQVEHISSTCIMFYSPTSAKFRLSFYTHLFLCQFSPTSPSFPFCDSSPPPLLGCHGLSIEQLFLTLCFNKQALWVFPSFCLSSVKLQCIPSVTQLIGKLFSDCFNSDPPRNWKVLCVSNLPP